MNEELRSKIEARRDAWKAQWGTNPLMAARTQELEWVLDLLDAQPAAVSLPEEAEPELERLRAIEAAAREVVVAWSLPDATDEQNELIARNAEALRCALGAQWSSFTLAAPAVSLELPEPPRRTPNREPQPSDGPDYHADHAAWRERNPAPLPEPEQTGEVR